MSGQQEVLDYFLDRLARIDGVSLAVVYGSFGTPAATAGSDVDMFFVPESDGARDAACQVIVGDIGYDLWAVDWSRLERIAGLEDPLTPLLLDGRVAFGDAGAVARFEELRTRCRAALADPAVRSLAAGRLLDRAAAAIGRSGGTGVLDNAGAVGAILTATAYRAGAYLPSGPGRVLDEGAPWLGEDVREALTTALLAPTGAQRAAGLAAALACADAAAAEPSPRPSEPVEALSGWYEELHSVLGKIPRSVRAGRNCTAVLAAADATAEIAGMFAMLDERAEVPDLVGALAGPDVARMVAAAGAQVRGVLTARGVPIRSFETVGELRAEDAQSRP